MVQVSAKARIEFSRLSRHFIRIRLIPGLQNAKMVDAEQRQWRRFLPRGLQFAAL
jgi:hypothetical protein